jgi:selenide,water dikinase
MTDPRLIRGLESPDDAGVYRISDDVALIQTVDFFTPIVDDPYTFGQIAAANALSDVYAMGGQPLTAMNIVCFPVKTMEIDVLREILRGGVTKILEAGAVLLGGPSVEDSELKYGLAVTGTVHPDKLVANAGAKPGDRLLLTKPLGTGIISTAVKAEMASDELAATIAGYMATLNRVAAELMTGFEVHAATDVTGFGLLGHGVEIAQNSEVDINIAAAAVPVFPEALEFASQGLCPAGLFRNRDFFAPSVTIDDGVPDYLADILNDPQTSGGLLISLAADQAATLLEQLRQNGIKEAAIIGEVTASGSGKIRVI